MCGIAGVWQFGGGAEDELRAQAASMAEVLRHRGPDDGSVWSDATSGVAFGFRRLAIVDLTDAGSQPMVSHDGRYVLVFNGEVYNFLRLRTELERDGHRVEWRGHCDAEVVLECIARWGVENAVRRFIGMFAFALWDRHERTLSLVRDRLGVKPLYYEASSRRITFASELKALVTDHDRTIDRGAVALYARYGYVPAPWSIYEGIRKLEPGCILVVREGGLMETRPFWEAARVAEERAANPFTGGVEDAADAIEELLRDSIRLRLISDVPLGLYLSSGIDSTLVAALMASEGGAVSTFTIGLTDLPSEAPRAAAIARYLGTRHTEHSISGADVLEAIPQMAGVYDEPFDDSSQVPTYLVSRAARQSVTVALSGDGGDEMFGGYHRYFLAEQLHRKVASVPRPLRRPLGHAMRRTSRISTRRFSERLRRVGDALIMDDRITHFLGEVTSDALNVRGAEERPVALTRSESWPRLRHPTELAMFLDAVSYLTDDVLMKVDRASMAVSLEVREPLLDHRIVELAWSLPMSMKVRDGVGKWILRRVLRRHVPDELIEREKIGFGLPVSEWLHGPLRDWAASLADPKRIAAEGFFDPDTVRRLSSEASGDTNSWWRVLMFQRWLDTRRIARP